MDSSVTPMYAQNLYNLYKYCIHGTHVVYYYVLYTLTCLDHVVHGWEAFADSGADGAEDEERCQVNVTY